MVPLSAARLRRRAYRMAQVREEGRHRKGWADGGLTLFVGEGEQRKDFGEEEQCSGKTDGQTDMHTYSSPPEASVTLLARRSCFHGDTKLLSRVADPLLLGSGKLKKNPSMLKQWAWGHHEASLHSYLHPLGLGYPSSPLTLLDNIHELLVELVACLLGTVALGMKPHTSAV